MHALICRYPAVSFIVLTYALTYSIWALILNQFGPIPIQSLVSSPAGVAAVYAGAGAPTIIAIFLTAIISGRAGLTELFSRVTLLRVNPLLWLAAFGVPLIVAGVATFMMSGTLGKAQMPAWYHIIPPSALLLFLAGPLCEEIGWRGFLQPKLLAVMSPLKAVVIIGTIWCFWHVPLSYTPGTTPVLNSIDSWATYWLSTVASSAIMMAIVVLGRGSIALAMAFHWAGNAAFSQIIHPVFPAATPAAWQNVQNIDLVLSCLLAAACLIWLSRNHHHLQNTEQ